MARKPRYEVANPSEVQVFHAVQRCVRRAFLCKAEFGATQTPIALRG
jgi:hypothetical protein